MEDTKLPNEFPSAGPIGRALEDQVAAANGLVTAAVERKVLDRARRAAEYTILRLGTTRVRTSPNGYVEGTVVAVEVVGVRWKGRACWPRYDVEMECGEVKERRRFTLNELPQQRRAR